MKIIVTHASPDWDAIASVWLIKRFLPGWENAEVKFVPAGERLEKASISHVENDAHKTLLKESSLPRSLSEHRLQSSEKEKLDTKSAFSSFSNEYAFPIIENIKGNEVIHVDTGLGPLDHHQLKDVQVSAATLTWDFIEEENPIFILEEPKQKRKKEAIKRMLKVLTDLDHFKELFWEDASADYYEFSIYGYLEGLKLLNPGNDLLYIDSGIQYLEAILTNFENRIWAEEEIKEKGKEFMTKFGKAIGVETINDNVLKLAQKMGYVVVVRKDPRKGYVKIKAKPVKNNREKGVDLTNLYEKLSKIDPDASWYLHVSKKMLLNGSPKNPKMKPTKLSLSDIIRVLETI